jgi:hypothetical protein
MWGSQSAQLVGPASRPRSQGTEACVLPHTPILSHMSSLRLEMSRNKGLWVRAVHILLSCKWACPRCVLFLRLPRMQTGPILLPGPGVDVHPDDKWSPASDHRLTSQNGCVSYFLSLWQNIWENQLKREKIVLAHCFRSFSSWLPGSLVVGLTSYCGDRSMWQRGRSV